MIWIPRTDNTKADVVSRCFESDDQFIKDEIYRFLDLKWGPYSIDRFVSNMNSRCSRFHSKRWVPGTEAVHCFSQDWYGVMNGFAPPPNCVL